MKTYNTLEELGKAIREERKRQGFTQSGLAVQMGISHTLARDIEMGKQSVKAGNLFRYMDELGIRHSIDIPDDKSIKAKESW